MPVDTDTRTRLLDAAESLLLDAKYDDVSVRSICAAADVNVAAVHYHFGSKRALVTALLEDRLGPTWATPLAELAESGAPVGEFVRAVIAPLRTLAADPIGRCHLRLLADMALRSDEPTWQAQWFTLESWIAVLPELDPKEAGRRWLLAFELILLHFGGERAQSSVTTLESFVTAGLLA